jgi:hypothetical protein
MSSVHGSIEKGLSQDNGLSSQSHWPLAIDSMSHGANGVVASNGDHLSEAPLAEVRVVDGDPAAVEEQLLDELEEIEYRLGEADFKDRECDGHDVSGYTASPLAILRRLAAS